MMKMGDSAARDGRNGNYSPNCITLVPAHVVSFSPLSPGEFQPRRDVTRMQSIKPTRMSRVTARAFQCPLEGAGRVTTQPTTIKPNIPIPSYFSPRDSAA